MCLAQRHNTMTPVRLEPAAPWSRVKHSNTEPPALPNISSLIWIQTLCGFNILYIYNYERAKILIKAQICNYIVYTAPNNYQVTKWCTWVKVFRIYPEFRILISICWIREIIIASLIIIFVGIMQIFESLKFRIYVKDTFRLTDQLTVWDQAAPFWSSLIWVDTVC